MNGKASTGVHQEQVSLFSFLADSVFLSVPGYETGGQYAKSIAVADVNGDGKPDLVVANSCSISGDCLSEGVLGVLLGNGDGSFQTAATYGSGGYAPLAIAVGDVNGDGKLDLLVANDCADSSNCSGGVVSVLLGNGDGTFQPAVSYASGGFDAQSVAVSDVNGDGKLDLLVANDCSDSSNCVSGAVGVLLGNGDGTFQKAITYNSGGYNSISVAVTDVHSDGKPDLLVASACSSSSYYPYGTTGVVGVLLGNGDGTFRTVVTYNSGGYLAEALAVADINGDGRPDLVVSNACGVIFCPNGVNGVIGVLLGNGDGTFGPPVSFPSGALTARSLAIADVNGDGKLDLLVAATTGANGVVDILLGNGDGTFRTPTNYSSGGQFALSIAVADVNGDGKSDLLVANDCTFYNNQSCGNPGGMAGVLLGNGDGTFLAALTYSLGGAGNPSIAVGDLNGDGKLDLLVADACIVGYCASTVGTLLGNGDGTFQTVSNYSSAGYSVNSVSIADVNGDGKADLLVANECADSSNCSNGTVSVLLGNGDGTFQTGTSYSSGGQYATSVQVADVNGDGKPDLLVSNQCDSINCTDNSTVGVLLGNGDGTFQTAVNYPTGGHYSYSLAVSDVNGDGIPDVLVINECASSSDCSSGGVVGVLIGNGDGTFKPTVTFSSGGYAAYSLAVGDVNGDGKPDVLVASLCPSSNCAVGGDGGMSVLLGNGDGTFQTATVISTPTITAGPFVLADFNGDGNLDVASAVGNFLLLGNGNGTFQPSIPLGYGGVGIAVGDFNGDGKTDLAIGGLTVLLNISVRSTTTALSSSVNPSSVGQTITFTVTVTPQGKGTPTGTVNFWDGATSLGSTSLNSNGVATLTISTLAVGTHSVTATYNGDSNFSSSTSPVLSQVVQGAIAVLSPTSVNFGNQTVGIKNNQSALINLTNTGNAALTISSIGITGTNSADFALNSNLCPSSLAAGFSCTMTVSFNPTTAGTRNATLSVSDNAPGSPQTVSLTGVGVTPTVSLSPASLTFPTQVIFTASKALTVTLTNSGLGILSITNVSVASPFSQANTCGTTVAAGASCTFTVTFRPTKSGTVTGSVSITDNASGSPQKITLTGTGTDIQLSPTSLNFGNQPVGTKSVSKKITLSNKGSVSVSITSISLTGTNAKDFSQTNTCGTSVKSGASCSITVNFTPSAKGKRTGNVSVNDNGGGSPQTVGLSGTGT